MRYGVLGTGVVGTTLADGLLALGHEVRMGSRTADNAEATAWAAGKVRASHGTFADAAQFGEALVLATSWDGTKAALALCGPEHTRAKLLIDVTNPLDFSHGAPPRLADCGGRSGGELVAQWSEARVVKAFNIVGAPFMVSPKFPGGPPTMFIAGDDADAKRWVVALAEAFGWEVADSGPLASAAYLEAMAMVWIIYGFTGGSWAHAFKMLKA